MINRLLLGWVLVLSTVVVWPVLLPLPVLAASIVVAALFRRHPFWVGALCAVVFGQLAAHQVAGELRWLPSGNHQLEATLMTANTGAALYQRNQWLVESVDGVSIPWFANRIMQLSWRNPPPLIPGQGYRLNVAIKPDTSVLNEAGFNSVRHQYANGISIRGWVRKGELLQDHHDWRHHQRQRLADLTSAIDNGDIIRALSLGDKDAISNQRWQQMRQSGLIHLLAVSGLHLSIVAGLVLALLTSLQRYCLPSADNRWRPLTWLITAFVALGYGWLVGMGLPTLRATTAVLLAMLLLWQLRIGRPWEMLLRIAALVLLLQPLASLSAGYWLSFSAVMVILLHSWWWGRATGWRQRLLWFVLLQLSITVVLNLLQGLWFGQFSLHGMWANLLLLPFFSLVALPVVLVTVLLVLLGAPDQLLLLADWVLWPVANVAELAAQHQWGYGNLSSSTVWLLALGLVVLLLTYWRHWRAAGIAALCGLLWWWPLSVAWQLDMLDVGQGSALLISHQQRHLLVDVGAAYPSGFSYAERVILPVLQRRGIDRLELLVISHGDNDHAGGLNALKGAIEVEQHIGFGGQPCSDGPERLGDLQLSWFQPPLRGNDGSCVLLIDSGQHRLLLPGDIEQAGEQAWLAQQANTNVDLLLAPHHGSTTSSSVAFVEATSPKWVLISAGRNNRWGFPKASVLKRYLQQGSTVVTSGDSGQVQIKLYDNGEISLLKQRQHRAPWWYNQQ